MRLLTNKQFFILFLGRILTNIADSIYYIAAMWIVYDLSGNAFYVGLAGFLTSLPWALQFLTGPLVDKWPTKSVLVWSQSLQAVLLMVIPLLALLDQLTVFWVLVLLPIVSMIQQFVYPAQTKALPQIVEKEELVPANTYFSFAYQGIDFILNAVAGVFVTIVGVVWLFTIDSLLFAIAAMLFVTLRIPGNVGKTKAKVSVMKRVSQYRLELKSGFKYVVRSVLGLFTLGTMVTNFAIGGIMALLPAFADMQGGSSLYGFYLAALSIGGLLGSTLAPRIQHIRIGIFYIVSFSLATVCWIIAVSSVSPVISLIFFGLVWLPVGASNIIVPSAIQATIPTGFIGRVNSVSVSMSTVSMPFGSILAGYLGTIIDLRLVFLLFGLVLFFEVIIWLSHPVLRKMPNISELDAKALRLPEVHEE